MTVVSSQDPISNYWQQMLSQLHTQGAYHHTNHSSISAVTTPYIPTSMNNISCASRLPSQASPCTTNIYALQPLPAMREFHTVAAKGCTQCQVGQQGDLPPPREIPPIPTLNTLRSMATEQQLIQQRLDQMRELGVPSSDGESTHCCHADQSKKRKKVPIVWPQDCVFIGPTRIKVSYDQLNSQQFVATYVKTH